MRRSTPSARSRVGKDDFASSVLFCLGILPSTPGSVLVEASNFSKALLIFSFRHTWSQKTFSSLIMAAMRRAGSSKSIATHGRLRFFLSAPPLPFRQRMFLEIVGTFLVLLLGTVAAILLRPDKKQPEYFQNLRISPYGKIVNTLLAPLDALGVGPFRTWDLDEIKAAAMKRKPASAISGAPSSRPRSDKRSAK